MATPTALPPLPFNPGRVRSYLVRLPLFTRLVLLVILAFWLLELQTIWSVVEWGALIPNEINLGTSMLILPNASALNTSRGRLC
jgi:glycosylphosphatidylinositol transamidase